jgi:Spy/CpxP family protein refolding chaperone
MKKMRSARLAGVLTLVALAASIAATPASADTYDPQKAGHPLRIVAYALHPVGVMLDVLLMRPAHWVVTRDSMARLFGHERYTD